MSHTETVQKMYAAFGRGDVNGVVEHFAPDIEWEYGGHEEIPLLKPRRGRQDAAGFFGALSALNLTKFQPKHFLEKDGLVVAILDVEGTAVKTGTKLVEEDEVHLWHFNAAGQVSRFRHRADTYRLIKALGHA